MLRELARSYLTIVKDLSRVMNRLKAMYRSWAIPCAGRDARPQARRELLAESRKHLITAKLRKIPSFGPIRSALAVALIQTPHRCRCVDTERSGSSRD
jgi:hypothetical protein